MYAQLQGTNMDTTHIEDKLLICRKLLLDPKWHKTRVGIIKAAVASGRKSRSVFRAPQTAVLNWLLDYAIVDPAGYTAFMADVKARFELAQKATSQKENTVLTKLRARTLETVQRVRKRKQLIRVIMRYQRGTDKLPSWKEVNEEYKKRQLQWALEAYEDMVLHPTGNQVQQRRKFYDGITQKLEAEVERLRAENEGKNKLERNNS